MTRLAITRRGIIGATLAAVPGAALGVAFAASDARPPFHLEPVSRSQWRFRSWTWSDGVWRPLTGDVTVESEELRVAGRPDPRDGPVLQAALAAIARDRSGSSAR